MSVPVPTFVTAVPVIGPEKVVDVLLPPAVSVNAPVSVPAPAKLPIVSFAASRRVAPEATVVADKSPMPVGPTTSVPAFTFVAPLYVLVPVSVVVPALIVVSDPVPVMLPANVPLAELSITSAALSTMLPVSDVVVPWSVPALIVVPPV